MWSILWFLLYTGRPLVGTLYQWNEATKVLILIFIFISIERGEHFYLSFHLSLQHINFFESWGGRKWLLASCWRAQLCCLLIRSTVEPTLFWGKWNLAPSKMDQNINCTSWALGDVVLCELESLMLICQCLEVLTASNKYSSSGFTQTVSSSFGCVGF